MKTLKYGLTLMLGLTMLGFGARLQAQSSSQTADVVPAHATPLPDVPAATAVGNGQVADEPQRGIPTPKAIEELINKKDYESAVKEFDKFIKAAKGDACELIYLRYTFYSRMMIEDMAHAADHKAQREACIEDLEKQCPNMPETYMVKTHVHGDGNPEAVLKWMDKAIEIDPKFAAAYIVRADALWLLQEDEKACDDYQTAAEMGDRPAQIRYRERCPNHGKK